MTMLSEVCRQVNNWFDKGKLFATFEIKDGVITNDITGAVQDGQYIRIVGSVFNDGVYRYPVSDLTDEVFKGAVWMMAVPNEFLSLVSDIESWQGKYGSVDSSAMSPFNSESFGGYSYSKVSGNTSAEGTNIVGWQGVFASRLNKWRKI